VPIDISGSMHDFVIDLNHAVDQGAPLAMRNAANLLYNKVMYAFRVGGYPSKWKELSKLTIFKKRIRFAPEPEHVLEEFKTMRDSIEIRETASSRRVPVNKSIGTYTFLTEGGTYRKRIFTTVDVYVAHEYSFSLGLFEDSYKATVKKQEISKKGNAYYTTVSRGIMHEYGGYEKQDIEPRGMEEVVTGRIKARALKGEQEVEKQGKEVRQRTVSKTEASSRIVRIPERSFLRAPFDASEDEMMDVIVNTVFGMIDAVLGI